MGTQSSLTALIMIPFNPGIKFQTHTHTQKKKEKRKKKEKKNLLIPKISMPLFFNPPPKKTGFFYCQKQFPYLHNTYSKKTN